METQMSGTVKVVILMINKTAEFILLDSGSDGKASAYSAGDLGSNPGSGRSPGEGNGEGNSLQYFSLENSMDRGTWQTTVHGVTVRHDLVT